MNNRKIIASLIEAANELDDLERHDDADTLSNIAQEIATSQENDNDDMIKFKQYLEDGGAIVQ